MKEKKAKKKEAGMAIANAAPTKTDFVNMVHAAKWEFSMEMQF